MLANSIDIFQRIGEIVVSQIAEEWRDSYIEAEIDEDLAELSPSISRRSSCSE